MSKTEPKTKVPYAVKLANEIMDALTQLNDPRFPRHATADRLVLEYKGTQSGGWGRRSLEREIVKVLSPAIDEMRAEVLRLRRQLRDVSNRAETADEYEAWLLDIGKTIGCTHLDEQLPNCVNKALRGERDHVTREATD